MIEHLEAHLARQQGPLKAALAELVRIPSVCDEGEGGHPFGSAIDQALRTTLRLASKLGFRTHYGDGGYYGYAELGAGAEMVGVLGHLDVVPPGQRADWARDPFEPVEIEGCLYGRGTQDDKGPMLAALFAAKALVDAGVTFHRRLRFIFGTDEETLWRCIHRYCEREELPDLGFSPDSRFPLTYAEKGLLQLQLEGPNPGGLRMTGGTAFNAVPDRACYDGDRRDALAAQLDAMGYAFTRTDAGIEVHGQSAHAMEPEKGVNAAARLCLALAALGVEAPGIRFVAEAVGEDPGAIRIFGPCADEASGPLTLNLGMIDLGDTARLSIDCRIPVMVPKDRIVAQLTEAAARYGLAYREHDWLAPLYVPRDHPLVATLMDIYRQETGDMASGPLTSGGATYARAVPNCVAFGALLPGEALTEHQPNERAVLANLYQAMSIYARAIHALTWKAE